MAKKNRRGHGEGSVFQRKDGRWVAQIELPRGPNGKRKLKQFYGRTQAEAINKRQRARARLDKGIDLSADNITVRDQLEHWLEVADPSLSPNTIASRQWAINKHLVPALGATRLSTLKASHVQRLLNDLTRSGLAPATVNRVRSVLNMAIRHAEIDGLVERNVAALSTPVPLGPTTSRAMSLDQAKALLQVCEGERLGRAFLLQLTTGIRPGETTGLLWQDVDLEARVVHIRRSLKNHNGDLVLGDTKTPGSRRSIALPEMTVGHLREQRKAQVREQLKAGSDWCDHGLVFSTQVGTPIDPANLRRAFRRACDRAKLGHWTPRELRHSAVTLLSAAGVPTDHVCDLAGHSDPRVTRRIYRHLEDHVHPHALPMDTILASDA